MTHRILLIASADARCRQVEDLLADCHTAVRRLGGPDDHGAPDEAPWTGPAPDVLVVGALGGTQAAVELVRRACAAEPDLSVLVVDEPGQWPEALRHHPGVLVVAPGQRQEFLAARVRLLERRSLLREVAARATRPDDDRMAAAALEGDLPSVREMRLMVERQISGRRSLVLSGEAGTLRRRMLAHLLRDRDTDETLLCVDDIDALAPAAQADVLERLRGGHQVVATATTHYRERVSDGSFRSDLYYALGGLPVVTVPLRERLDDLDRLAHAAGLDAVSEDGLARLRAHRWPGNLRELELVVEHARMLARGDTIAGGHVMLPAPDGARVPDRFVLNIPAGGISLDEIEREALRQTLEAAGSNIAEAARRLDIERGKLRYRLRRFGLGR